MTLGLPEGEPRLLWSRLAPDVNRDGLPGTRIVPGPLRCRRVRQPYEWPPRSPVALTSADGCVDGPSVDARISARSLQVRG